jgi:hypothetical protein
MRQERQESLFSGLSITHGSNKSGKFLRVCFAALLLSIAVSCSANNSAQTTNLQIENAAIYNAAVYNRNSNASDRNAPVNQENSKTAVAKNESSKTLDCNDPNGYSLVVVEDKSRNIEETVTVPEALNIVVDDEIKAAIKIPTGSEAKNFSLNSAEKTKEGFEIKADWGGWEYHYYLQYYFKCKDGNFFLYKVKMKSIEGKDPGDLGNWEKKETKIEPNLPIEKFSFFDYLTVK